MDHQLDERITYLDRSFDLVTSACGPNTARAELTTLEGQTIDILVQERSQCSSEGGEAESIDQLLKLTHEAMRQRLMDGYYNEESINGANMDTIGESAQDRDNGAKRERSDQMATPDVEDLDVAQDSAFPRMGAQFSILEVEENPRELEEIDPRELTEVGPADFSSEVEELDSNSLPEPDARDAKLAPPSLEENTAPYFEDSVSSTDEEGGDGRLRSTAIGVDDEDTDKDERLARQTPKQEDSFSGSPSDPKDSTPISPAIEEFFRWSQHRDLVTSIWTRNTRQNWGLSEQSQAAKKSLPSQELVSRFLADSESFGRLTAGGPGPLVTVWIGDDRAWVILSDDDVLTVTETELGELGMAQSRARKIIASTDAQVDRTPSPPTVDEQRLDPPPAPTPENCQGC